MEIKHVSHRGTSTDPIADALGLVVRLISGRSKSDPLRPEAFWEYLRSEGFYFSRVGHDRRLFRMMDSDAAVPSWGRFFASVVLHHAVGRGQILGDAAGETFWPK